MTQHQRLARWLDAQACGDLVLRFMGLFDLRDWAAMEACVTPDIAWQRPDLTVSGLPHLRETLRATPHNVRVRHVITNLRPTFVDDDHVRVDSYFTVYRFTGPGALADQAGQTVPLEGPVSVGRYADDLVRTRDGWRLSRKSTLVDFRRSTDARS